VAVVLLIAFLRLSQLNAFAELSEAFLSTWHLEAPCHSENMTITLSSSIG